MSKPPYTSLANLVEYAVTSSAARRRAIIEQYHEPKVFKLNWRGAADAVFAGRLQHKADVDDLIRSEKRRLSALRTGDAKRDQQPNHAIEVIELLETSDLEKVAMGCKVHPVQLDKRDLELHGLTVRVGSTLVLERRKQGRRYPNVGVVRCHSSSSFGLEKKAASLYATALTMFAERADLAYEVCPSLCRVYELYSDSVTSSMHQKIARQQLGDAAQEIVDRWELVGSRLLIKREMSRKAS